MTAYAGHAMGSRLRVILTSGDRVLTRRAWAAIRAEFARVEGALSRFDCQSALSRLNQSAGSGRWVAVPPIVRRSLVLAERARRMTSGRFDPRIIRALEQAGEPGGVPLPEPSRRDVSGRWLAIRRDGTVRIAMPVDLGGLGKGLALRGASRRLRAHSGLAGFLIDAGGDVVVAGSPPGGGPWRLGIEDPHAPANVVVGLAAGNLCLATSSVAVRRWDGPAGPAHHLIDPSTSRPAASGLLAVSVAGRDAAWAEIWSKSLFVSGAGRIGALADELRLTAWWVRDDERVGASTAARALERFRTRATASPEERHSLPLAD